MNCEIKSKSSNNVSISEISILDNNYLNKIKKKLKDGLNENNYKKILNNL